MFILDSGTIASFDSDKSRIAEYMGWTQFCSRRSLDFCLGGKPPDDELQYLGWRRRRKARSGDLLLPAYSIDLNAMRRVEKKLAKDGKGEEYRKQLRWVCENASWDYDRRPGEEVELGMTCANASARMLAAYLTLGFPLENPKDYQNSLFSLSEEDEKEMKESIEAILEKHQRMADNGACPAQNDSE